MAEHTPPGRRIAPMIRLGSAGTWAKEPTNGPMTILPPMRGTLLHPRGRTYPGSISF